MRPDAGLVGFEAWIAELKGDFAEVLNGLPSNTTGQMLVRFTESRCVQL